MYTGSRVFKKKHELYSNKKTGANPGRIMNSVFRILHSLDTSGKELHP